LRDHLYRQTIATYIARSVVRVSVCLCVVHTGELCKTAKSVAHCYGSKEPCVRPRWGPGPPREGTLLRATFVPAHCIHLTVGECAWTFVSRCGLSPLFSTSHLSFSLRWAGCCEQLKAVTISGTVDSVLRIQRVQCGYNKVKRLLNSAP